MKTVKNSRQEMIIKLIKEHDISTQEELTNLVRQNGFEATQATCSRDIKELGIIKITMPNNNTKYAVLDRTGDVAPGRLLSVFANSLVSVKAAMNIIVIKTLPGMAQAAASALDSIHLENCVGTIAGDDTVFVAATGVSEAEALVKTIRDMMDSGVDFAGKL
ncbi:MAG: arginine repressor [Saccharofermentans sp.]|nr:arginine repressor [Saccharofermentans sp.]